MSAKFYEFLKKSVPQVLVVEDEKEAIAAQNSAKVLGIDYTLLPDFRAEPFDDLRVFIKELQSLGVALNSYYKNPKKLLIAPFKTISLPLPKAKYYQDFSIAFGDSLNLKELKERLIRWGYSFVDLVEVAGEVSFRGDIIDIFPPNSDYPFRISLFDDEVESIRRFDISNQKSFKEELEAITILPALFSLDDEYEKLLQKVTSSSADVFEKDIASLGFWYLSERYNILEGKEVFASKPFEGLSAALVPEPKEYKDIEVANIDSFIEAKKDKTIKVLVTSKEQARRSFIKDISSVEFIYSDAILNIEGAKEVIISLNRAKKRQRKRASLIIDELKVGDYVVHEQHGIGIFEGIKEVSILGAKRDFVVLKYQGEDKLLVPVENLELLSRYIADSGAVAVVDKLGSASFSRLKAKVKTKLFEIAADIVKRAAQRAIKPGIKIDTPPEQAVFMAKAGFSYTQDQQRAIEKILQRLQSAQVMDMLLSGDVGFGKTEVAMNAIFAVVKNGYQAAMVVPTTLLSNQHYQTLKERLEPFGIKVAKIDRFVSAKAKKETLKALKEGSIDVVVGTHALFGSEFKNLALVVIDEEHKFGVKQKERLKNFAENVHLLSMSATPIPRSLNMALSQIKELAELRTPPHSRKGVRTYVKAFDKNLIKEVILRELRRGGQVFYIYNSIAGIEEKRKELQELLPTKRILVLHSKVNSQTTEKELLRFSKGEYDILLSTSIVESGIHMPNVNTIIVEGAERFGLADLHQLRGRVGRGKNEGYCYYIVEDRDKLTDEAKKRLLALESNSYLGSGAALAYYDLEIRGGGNIIGAQQSGHIKNIGYSLYLKMLEDAITKLTTGQESQKAEVEVKLSVNAYLSKELISEDRLKLELYRRLSQAQDVDEVSEIEEEIKDRFGAIDKPSRNFLDIVTIKILALKRGIKKISNYGQNITFEYGDKKEFIKAKSKDEEDILEATLAYLHKKGR